MENKNLRKTSYSHNLIYGEVRATRGATHIDSVYQMYGVSGKRVNLIKQLYQENKFKVIWYIIFLTLGISCLIIEPKSYLMFAELILCMVASELLSRAKITGQILMMLECFLYAYISYKNGLYGEVIKSLAINLSLATFSLISWIKNLNLSKEGQTKQLKIRKLSTKGWIISGVGFVVISVVAYFMLKLLGTTSLIISAVSLSISVIYRLLNALCYKEGWAFAVAQTTIGLILWVSTMIISIKSGTVNLVNLPLIVMYLSLICNGIYAYILWKAMYKKSAINGGVLLAKRNVKIHKIVKLRKRYKKLYWDKKIDMAKNS